MGLKIVLFTVLALQFLCISSKIIPIIEEKHEDCLQSGSAQILDISNLKFVHKNDNYFVNGKFNSIFSHILLN